MITLPLRSKIKIWRHREAADVIVEPQRGSLKLLDALLYSGAAVWLGFWCFWEFLPT